MDDFRDGRSTSPCDALNDRLNAIARVVLGLSHELNNAFGAMQSNVDIMRRHLPDDLQLQANLKHIQNASSHVMDLTHVLQIYTQCAKAKLNNVNLQPLLARVIKIFKSTLPEHTKIHTHFVRGDIFAFTCEKLLEDAIHDILQNALEALQGNPGTLSVEMAIGFDRVRVGDGLLFGTPPAGNGLLIEISDTGEGMSPEVLKHCLEPFFTTRLRAHGLGLAPVAGLAFHCNAAVHITSFPGQGTTVQLLLPAAE